MNTALTYRSTTYRSTGLLTVLHLLVDGMCACSVFMLQPSLMGTGIAVLFVGYNVLAFMTQPFVGMWMDRRRPGSLCLWAAVLLLFSGALLTTLHPLCRALPAELPLLAIVALLLGMGNSLFHVYAGRTVTDSTSNDLRHLGVFVSTGALGLALGGALHSLVLMVVLAVAMLAVVYAFGQKSAEEKIPTEAKVSAKTNVPAEANVRSEAEIPVKASENAVNADAATDAATDSTTDATAAVNGTSVALLLFMLLLVFGRSFVGSVKPTSVQSIAYYAIIASVLAFVGKAYGGFLARRFGVWTTLTATLLLSGVSLLLSGVHWTFAVLLVLVINLTMPLTLHLANRSMPQRTGFAFGALAFMLIPGHALALYLGSSTTAVHLLYTLVATIVIEALVLLALRERRWKVFAASVAMNVLTNLPLNLAVRFVPALHHPSLPMQIVLEMVVVTIETALFYIVTRHRRTAVLYALLCNATSYLCGLLFGIVYSLFIIAP